MRISFVASLLFSGSIALVESAPEIPASFHDAFQSYSAKRDQLLQYSKEEVLHPVLAQIQSSDASNRDLQATSAPTRPPLCNADQSVNFDDDFSQIAFASVFNPTCSCSVDSNQMEVSAALRGLLLNVTDSFADDFNTLFGSLYSDVAYTCTNGCESCYDGVCGLLETTRESSVSYNKPNFTIDQIFNQQIDEAPFVANFSSLVLNCVQYTSGVASNGQLCFGIDLDNPADFESAGQPCILEYNDVACNSCDIDFSTFNACYVADCTNIDASASIDSCAGTGFVGPFVFLGTLVADDFNATDLTLGSCDGQPAPVAPTAPTSVETPVAAPVSEPTAPVSEPTAPVSEPTAPVSEPTAPVSSPTAPVASPTAPVKAPSAPVKTPVQAPTAPTTSGSSGINVALSALFLGFISIATYFM